MAYLLCWMVHFWIQLSTVTRTLSYHWQQTKCCLKKAGYAEQTGQQLKYHLANYGLGPNHPQYKQILAPINNSSVLVPATSNLSPLITIVTFQNQSLITLETIKMMKGTYQNLIEVYLGSVTLIGMMTSNSPILMTPTSKS